MNLKENYNQIITLIEKSEVPCTVNLLENQILIETGRDVPDELDDELFDIAKRIGLSWGRDISSCAEQSGHTIIDSTRIRGNRKKWKV